MNQDDRLGPYRLLRRLGEGGMGVVHLALDPHGRQVAVKVLRPEVAGDDVARRRLAREVETMRRVRSAHIAEVVDADVTGHRPYIVTRYVPGRPLDEIVKQDGPLGLDALLRIGGGVAEALAAVHAAGVIHRDLKPGNVLMLDGEPVLIDFGIAQAVDATRLTQTGMFIGTPGYLAPEIIEGHEAGPEVDVHAWAGTLLFAATGQPPFGKGTLEMIFFNITSGKANVDGAPQSLRPVLRAALQREPAKRPTAAELSAQIGRLQPQSNRPRVPDEITTVPNIDERTGQPIPIQLVSGALETPPVTGQRLPLPTARPSTGSGSQPVVSSPVPPVTGPGAAPPTGPRQQPGTPTASPTGPRQQPVAPAASTGPSGPAGGSGGSSDQFVSLLGEAPSGGQPGDPFPTVRVTGEDLRKAGLTAGVQPEQQTPLRYEPPTSPRRTPPTGPQPTGPQEGDIPTRMGPPQRGTWPPQSAPQTSPHAPASPGQGRPAEGDVPTRRVRPEELREAQTRASAQAAQGGPGQGGQGGAHSGQGGRGAANVINHGNQMFFEQAPEIFDQTPQVHQPHPAPFLPTMRVPPPVPAPPLERPTLQRSKAYSVAGTLLLIAMTGAAVLAPLLVLVLALPVVLLLRAADIAQPQLNSRRPLSVAATDVIRVLSQPAAVFKSLGVTLALVPYALILGLPVTLLLAVLVKSMSTASALAWGVAVALWTICAGPGVEGPSRQMRRMLASLFPSRSAATGLAWSVGVIAVILGGVALLTVNDYGNPVGGHFWGPVDTGSITLRLADLRDNAGN
ncbi:protein kinase [Streptosporangiaceae bacterium NEAU-GS5]|nr:protein kinase [Streptosporangiaceae bacterium NEAU-GS5]